MVLGRYLKVNQLKTCISYVWLYGYAVLCVYIMLMYRKITVLGTILGYFPTQTYYGFLFQTRLKYYWQSVRM